MHYGTVNGGEFVAEMAKKGGVAALTNPTSSLRRYNHNTVIQLIYYVMQSLMPQVAMKKSDGQRRETSLCVDSAKRAKQLRLVEQAKKNRDARRGDASLCVDSEQ